MMNSFFPYHHHLEDPTGSLKQFLSDFSHWYQEKTSLADNDPLESCAFISRSFDNVVLTLLSTHFDLSSDCCVIALGGYGREEMSIYTDLDLLFLATENGLKKIEALLNDVLYPFWNNGVRIGGATRTLKDCKTLFAKGDVRSVTAMLEYRFLWGNKTLYQRFEKLVQKSFKQKKIYEQFLTLKKEEQSKRKKRYEQSVYLLEPNIKESPGALRSIHFICWLLKAREFYFSRCDLPEALHVKMIELDLIHRFYWRLRHALHAQAKKGQDRLYANVQEEIAKRLYFQENAQLLASEQFMKQYYRSAHYIHFFSQQVLESLQKELDEESFFSFLTSKRNKKRLLSKGKYGDAEEMLQCFLEAAKKRKILSSSLMFELSNNSHLITKKSWNEKTQEMWKEFFSSSDSISSLLSQLYECGHLEKWFPELSSILHLLQHNGYHYYTVDAHSLRAVMELENLFKKKKGDSFLFAQSEVKDLAVLRLAALFHDIGKGRGGDHSALGAEIVSQLANKMGFDAERAKNLSWLVKSHLLMPKLAFRRDVSDMGMIKRFVQSLPSPSLLSSLYFLTIADLKAVGPGVWTDWKAKLLREFYTFCYKACLTQGELTEEYEKRKKVHLEKLQDLLEKKNISFKLAELFLSRLPSRYIFSVSPYIIAEHIVLFSSQQKLGLQLSVYEDEKTALSYLVLLGKDRPGLFSQVCGVLSYYSANIVDAKIFTSQDGYAVDVFAVTAKDGSRFDLMKKLDLISFDLLQTETDEQFLSKRLENNFSSEQKKKFFDLREIKIEIDNDVSETDTVIEIHAYDEAGLLYRLSRALVESRANLHLAYIVTQVERVIDVFYLRDYQGNKITNKEQLKILRQNIEKRIF